LAQVVQRLGEREAQSNVLGSISQVHVLHQHNRSFIIFLDPSWCQLTETKFSC
jgi:hypothetical protein